MLAFLVGLDLLPPGRALAFHIAVRNTTPSSLCFLCEVSPAKAVFSVT